MITFLYSLRDLKSQYTPPVALQNDEMAKRYMAQLVNQDKTISMYPEDFDMVRVGKFDTENGTLLEPENTLICNGKEFER